MSANALSRTRALRRVVSFGLLLCLSACSPTPPATATSADVAQLREELLQATARIARLEAAQETPPVAVTPSARTRRRRASTPAPAVVAESFSAPTPQRALMSTPEIRSARPGYVRGPRGGCYTYSASGRKRYVDHSFCGG